MGAEGRFAVFYRLNAYLGGVKPVSCNSLGGSIVQ